MQTKKYYKLIDPAQCRGNSAIQPEVGCRYFTLGPRLPSHQHQRPLASSELFCFMTQLMAANAKATQNDITVDQHDCLD